MNKFRKYFYLFYELHKKMIFSTFIVILNENEQTIDMTPNKNVLTRYLRYQLWRPSKTKSKFPQDWEY